MRRAGSRAGKRSPHSMRTERVAVERSVQAERGQPRALPPAGTGPDGRRCGAPAAPAPYSWIRVKVGLETSSAAAVPARARFLWRAWSFPHQVTDQQHHAACGTRPPAVRPVPSSRPQSACDTSAHASVATQGPRKIPQKIGGDRAAFLPACAPPAGRRGRADTPPRPPPRRAAGTARPIRSISPVSTSPEPLCPSRAAPKICTTDGTGFGAAASRGLALRQRQRRVDFVEVQRVGTGCAYRNVRRALPDAQEPPGGAGGAGAFHGEAGGADGGGGSHVRPARRATTDLQRLLDRRGCDGAAGVCELRHSGGYRLGVQVEHQVDRRGHHVLGVPDHVRARAVPDLDQPHQGQAAQRLADRGPGPKRSASSRSGGSRAPAPICSLMIRFRICSATESARPAVLTGPIPASTRGYRG